jgi:DNA-binding beta-propeller fold protein YncE/mono/diheme cytochrome c family protein
MRSRTTALALGTLVATTLLAHAEKVQARRLPHPPRKLSPPAFVLDGPALAAAGTVALSASAAAPLAGSAIAALPDGALVIDPDSGDLVRTDRAGAPIARLAIGPTASQLVYDAAAGRAYVASRGGDEIVAIDVGAGLAVAARWPTPTEPYGLALTPDRGLLLVTTVAAQTLVAYDPATGRERWRRPLAPEPRSVAIAPDGASALVTSLTTGAVERIDLAAPTATRTIALGGTGIGASPGLTLGTLVHGNTLGRGQAKNAFAARFVGRDLALVAHQVSEPLQATRFENRGSYGGGSESPIRHHLTFIAAGARAPRTVAARIALHQPKAVAWDPGSDRALVVGYGSDTLLILSDVSRRTVAMARTVGLGSTGCGPEGVAVDDAGVAWVFCAVSRTVVRVEPSGKVDVGAVALAPTNLSPAAHRGFDLFRKGNDHRLSSAGSLACASCHPEGGADGLTWRIEGHELQTPVLAGRIAGTHPYKWDGGDADLTVSLTATMRRLGGAGLPSDDVAALAAYLEALPRPRAAVADRAAVARGQALFASDEVGCANCHGGPTLSDQEQHAFGGDLAKADTPSLVGLARSAPYYHDGSAATLEALVAERAAVHGMAEMTPLTPAQRADLVAFLRSL